MSTSAIPRELRAKVLSRDRGRCQYCHLVQMGQGATFHINHVVPRSRSGATDMTNLVLQCPSCSLHKSDKMLGVDEQSGLNSPLFHPLEQHWHEHFVLTDDGTCIGTTSIGRATVKALHMNDPLPKTARAMQINMKLL